MSNVSRVQGDSIMVLALVMSSVLSGTLGSWDALPSDQPHESHSRTPDLLLTKESIQRLLSGAKHRSEQISTEYRRKISRMTTDRATGVETAVPTQCRGRQRRAPHGDGIIPAAFRLQLRIANRTISGPFLHAPCIHRCPESISHTPSSKRVQNDMSLLAAVRT